MKIIIVGCGRIEHADALAAVTSNDEVNALTARVAREIFSVPRVVARSKNPQNAWLFTPKMGVDVALNQAELMASLVVEEISMVKEERSGKDIGSA